jgi:hypothetical protein
MLQENLAVALRQPMQVTNDIAVIVGVNEQFRHASNSR